MSTISFTTSMLGVVDVAVGVGVGVLGIVDHAVRPGIAMIPTAWTPAGLARIVVSEPAALAGALLCANTTSWRLKGLLRGVRVVLAFAILLAMTSIARRAGPEARSR